MHELDFIVGWRNLMLAIVPGLQTTADDSTLKWYKELQSLASHCAQSFEDLNNTKDMQVKKSTGIINDEKHFMYLYVCKYVCLMWF